MPADADQPQNSRPPEINTEFNITRELQNTFHEAIRKDAAKSLKTPQDWENLRKLEDQYGKDNHTEEQRYLNEYDKRADKVRAHKMNETRKPRLTGPKPPGQNANTESFEAAVHRQVQQDHERDMQLLKDRLISDTLDLLETARAKNQVRGKSKQEFNTVNDRRSGVERRKSMRSRT